MKCCLHLNCTFQSLPFCVPENFLEDILSYLKQIEKKSRNDIEAFSDLKRIFKEDQELLDKLAK